MTAPEQPAPLAGDADRKRLSTLRARAALAGLVLHQLDGGRLLVIRFGLVREVDSLDAAEAMLLRMGATP